MSATATPSAIGQTGRPPAVDLLRRLTGVSRRLGLTSGQELPRYTSIRYWDQPSQPMVRPELAPVLLVHGYGGTHRMWTPLLHALHASGFSCVIALRYNSSRNSIEQIADLLVDRATRSMAATGIGRVHLVGHSLGGLVIREAVQRGGLAGSVSTAVTIAAPHNGARLARFVPGPAARQMCPESEFLMQLNRLALDRRTHWVAIAGTSDRVVPSDSTAFEKPPPETVTIRQSNGGHRSIARCPQVVTYIAGELLRTEAPAHQAFSLAA